MPLSYDEAVRSIIETGHRLHTLGLAAATSGNFSARLSDGRIAITVSGRHKGRLSPSDIMLLDREGSALEDKKPSAETALHTVMYRQIPSANAVLHVHSVPAVALTRHGSGRHQLVLQGYEMLKAFPGISTHEAIVRIPIYENTQDVAALAQTVAHDLRSRPGVPAYLIRGHGAYGWGVDLDEAERVIEALDHLLRCELEALRLKGGVA
jgi:methylthioribulose-1-phosphate dehydratase